MSATARAPVTSRTATPKVAGACSVCDTWVRAFLKSDRVDAPRGARLPGTRTVTLVHRDGTHSEHSLCATCTVDADALPLLWARAVALYARSIDARGDRRVHERYSANVPLGVRCYGEPVPEEPAK